MTSLIQPFYEILSPSGAVRMGEKVTPIVINWITIFINLLGVYNKIYPQLCTHLIFETSLLMEQRITFLIHNFRNHSADFFFLSGHSRDKTKHVRTYRLNPKSQLAKNLNALQLVSKYPPN